MACSDAPAVFLSKNMENVISISNAAAEVSSPRGFAVDTTFVLFFLALDLGSGIYGPGVDAALSILTIATFVVLPYLLPFSGEKPEFAGWAVGRLCIAGIGVIAGMGIQTASGTIFPEFVRFVPMLLLIVSGIFCAAVQIRGTIRVRLAS